MFEVVFCAYGLLWSCDLPFIVQRIFTSSSDCVLHVHRFGPLGRLHPGLHVYDISQRQNALPLFLPHPQRNHYPRISLHSQRSVRSAAHLERKMAIEI